MLGYAVDVAAAVDDLTGLNSDCLALGEHIACICSSASLSFSSPYCGTMSAAVNYEKIHVGCNADIAILAGDSALNAVDAKSAFGHVSFRHAELCVS